VAKEVMSSSKSRYNSKLHKPCRASPRDTRSPEIY
jgi:hypothetical protein